MWDKIANGEFPLDAVFKDATAFAAAIQETCIYLETRAKIKNANAKEAQLDEKNIIIVITVNHISKYSKCSNNSKL